jgi:hypothetical protein
MGRSGLIALVTFTPVLASILSFVSMAYLAAFLLAHLYKTYRLHMR